MRLLAFLPLLAALLAPSCQRDTPRSSPAGPDVVLVLVDTLRPDHLGLYGYGADTSPFLDELGREGAVFLSAFSTSGWTPPATATTLTGLYPTTHGVVHGFETNERTEEELAAGGAPTVELVALPTDHPTLAERFQAAGYDTFGLTTNVHIRESMGFSRGFDRFWHREDASVEEVAEALDAWSAELERDTPSFLYLHLNDVHRPYEPHSPWYVAYDDALTDAVSRYDSEIRYLDEQLRQLAERYVWRQNTVLCFVSDHGEAFGEHGMTGHGPSLHAPVNRVLFLLHGPGIPAVREDANVSLVDVTPTLLDAAGLGTPDDVEGTSLLPLLSAETRVAERARLRERTLFAHRRTRSTRLDRFLWSAVRGPWKMIHDDDAGTDVLYDLSRDAAELNDLSGTHGAELEALRAERAAFLTGARKREGAAIQVELDPELARHLREMGYAGED